jgi:hypothetical protein
MAMDDLEVARQPTASRQSAQEVQARRAVTGMIGVEGAVRGHELKRSAAE